MSPVEMLEYWEMGRAYRYMGLTADALEGYLYGMGEDAQEEVWTGYVHAVWRGLFKEWPSPAEINGVKSAVRTLINGH